MTFGTRSLLHAASHAPDGSPEMLDCRGWLWAATQAAIALPSMHGRGRVGAFCKPLLSKPLLSEPCVQIMLRKPALPNHAIPNHAIQLMLFRHAKGQVPMNTSPIQPPYNL